MIQSKSHFIWSDPNLLFITAYSLSTRQGFLLGCNKLVRLVGKSILLFSENEILFLLSWSSWKGVEKQF